MNKHYVYIIGAKPDGPVKVGISTDCKRRMICLQTNSHMNLVLLKNWCLTYSNAKKLERTAHVELSGYRLKGEWFSCSPEIAIKAIAKISIKTKGFKYWDHYYEKRKAKIWLDSAASKGGRAKANNSLLKFWAGFSKIADRWHLKDTSKVLMKEAGIKHHDTVRVNLGYTRWEWRKLSDAKRARVLKGKCNV